MMKVIVFFSVSLLRVVFFVVGLPQLSVFFFCRVPQVPLGLWVRSGRGLRSSGDIRGTFPGFLERYGSWGMTDVAPCCWEHHPL